LADTEFESPVAYAPPLPSRRYKMRRLALFQFRPQPKAASIGSRQFAAVSSNEVLKPACTHFARKSPHDIVFIMKNINPSSATK
jgi:hypothetical protein